MFSPPHNVSYEVNAAGGFSSAAHWLTVERGACHGAAVQVISYLLVCFGTSQGEVMLL